jgi:hypothetical protein
MSSQETIEDPTLYQDKVCIDAKLMLYIAEHTRFPQMIARSQLRQLR